MLSWVQALGWSRHLGARAGSEDLCASLWKVLRDRGKEQGFSCASFPSPPQAHRISGSPQSVKYLLGLEHTQTIYFLSTKHERCGNTATEGLGTMVEAPYILSQPHDVPKDWPLDRSLPIPNCEP